MPSEFSDEELRLVVDAVVFRFLEVERGLRPPEHLRRLLTPQAYAHLRSPVSSRFFRHARPVRQSDIRRMVFQRPQPDVAHAAVPTRQQGDRWGAIVLELRADERGVWFVTQLSRAQDRAIVAPHPRERLVPPDEFDAVTLDRAKFALHAAQVRQATALERLGSIAPEKPAFELRSGDRIQHSRAEGAWLRVSSVEREDDGEDVMVHTVAGVLRLPGERPVMVVRSERQQSLAAEAWKSVDVTVREVARWSRVVEILQAEAATPAPVIVAERSTREPASEDVSANHAKRLLGERPAAGPAREAWSQAAKTLRGSR